VLGYNPDEMPHKSSAWQDIINQDDLKKAIENFTKHCENPSHPYDQIVRYTHKNNSIVWIRCRGLAIRDKDGKPIRMLGAHHNITEIKDRENELIEIEKKSSIWLKNSPICTKIVDLNFNLQYMSESGVKELKIDDITQFYGKPYPFYFYPDSFKIPMTKNLHEAKETGRIIVQEASVVDTKGEILWYHSTIVPVFNNNNEVDYIMVVSMETTNRKLAELALIEAKEKAEESDRLKTAFLQNISHEIRTPLNAISGFSGMLNKPELSEGKRKSFISIIQTSSKQLISIVSDILTISSLETKQEKANIDKVCINNIIVDLLSVFKQQAQNQNISLYTKQQLNDKHSEIYTDKTKITQILSNLISNALKFTYEGFIEFGYNLNENELEFYVKDSGIGIKPEFHEQIFERFRQADKSISKL
jgi:PAS domain S-box-containing protein